MNAFSQIEDVKKEVVEKIIHRHIDALPTDLSGILGYEQKGHDFTVYYVPLKPPPQYSDKPMTYTLGFAEEHQPYARNELSRIMAIAARAQDMTPLTGRRAEIAEKIRERSVLKPEGYVFRPEAF